MVSFTQKIVVAARDGALVLTANKRLFRALRSAYDRMMLDRGEQAWVTPQIFSLDGWFERQGSGLRQEWNLLPPQAARHLWEQIVEQVPGDSGKELLQVAATADKARQAAQLLDEYGVRLEDWPLTEDQQAFRRWLTEYHRRCAEHGWHDRSALIDQILGAIERGELAVPRHLVLAGFDQQPPYLQRLCRLVEASGGRVDQPLPQVSPAARLTRVACRDSADEIDRAARWARQLLEQGAGSVGIVATDLQARRSRIERVLRAHIDPAAAVELGASESTFSLSLGAPLGEQGPIHAAFELLAVDERLTLDQLAFLLRTPYLNGGVSEADNRARFDARLRSFRQQTFRLESLAQLLQNEQQQGTCRIPLFAGVLQRLQRQQRSSRARSAGEWALEFDRLLRDEKLGWLKGRSLSSTEYQAVKVWQDRLLPGFASLDMVARPLRRHQALAALRRLAAELEFQPETPTGPVQVVGLLEAAGLEFEHLWVMGAGEDALPAVARPNPFLPYALQAAVQMPHASAERELDFARQVLQRLKAAAGNVVFSYPQRDGDADLRPSPLILDLPLAEPQLAAAADAANVMRAAAGPLEEIEDHQGPPLAEGQGKGGTGILKDQALCPFRAFVHHRLAGRGFETAEAGLDALTRGNLVHKTLEILWRNLQSRERLESLNAAERGAQVETAVAAGLDALVEVNPAVPTALLEIERQRLAKLVEEWLLQVELARDAFQVVEIEVEHPARIGPLEIRTVVDRVDRLADGSLVIIDYKTGLQRLELLVGERLLEPQLPIYAISNGEAEADGVAFAQVRGGECRLVGVARADGLLPQVKGVETQSRAQNLELSDWPALLDHWRTQLEALAADFVAGVAKVDPVDRQLACGFCDLAGLCRIAEAVCVEEEA